MRVAEGDAGDVMTRLQRQCGTPPLKRFEAVSDLVAVLLEYTHTCTALNDTTSFVGNGDTTN